MSELRLTRWAGPVLWGLGSYDEFGFCWFSSSGKREKVAMVKQAVSKRHSPEIIKKQICEKGFLLVLFGSQVKRSDISETHHLGSNIRKHFLYIAP